LHGIHLRSDVGINRLGLSAYREHSICFVAERDKPAFAVCALLVQSLQGCFNLGRLGLQRF
jgi:hypothetical protein